MSNRHRWFTIVLSLGLFAIATNSAWSNPLTPGNILVSADERIRELTPTGNLLQSFSVESPIFASTHDVAVAADGRLVIYNGTFSAFYTVLDPVTKGVNDYSFPGLSTTSTLVGGGIATVENFAFTTDMATGSLPPTTLNGLIRFNITTGSGQRFADGQDFIDVAAGTNGLIYGLHTKSFPGGRDVEIYDPYSLVLVNKITLARHAVYALAANKYGEVFGGTEEGITRFSPTGGPLNDLDLPGNGIVGLDLDGRGNVIAITADGLVFLTNESLSTFTNVINIGGSLDHNVAFVSRLVPEPTSFIYTGLSLVMLFERRVLANCCRKRSALPNSE